MSTRFVFVAVALSCLALILTSCSGPATTETTPSASLDSSREADTSLFKDTVGSISELEGWDPIPIRGYGVVIGLPDTGSRECPSQIFLDEYNPKQAFIKLTTFHTCPNSVNMV